jgi:hypothetical protein
MWAAEDGLRVEAFTLDTATGHERWRLPRESGKSGYSTPLVMASPAGPQVVVTSNAHGITGIDPATGRRRFLRSAWPDAAG